MAEILGSFGTKPLEVLGQRQVARSVVPKSQTVSGIEAEDSALYSYPEVEPIETTNLQYAALEGAFAEDTAPEEALIALQDIGVKQEEFNRLLTKGAAISYTDVLNASDPEVTALKFKIEARKQEAFKRLSDLAEVYTGGTADSVSEFADQFIYDSFRALNPENIVRGISGEGTWMTRDSEEWQSALSSMSDEEFKVFLDSKIDSMSGATDLGAAGSAWMVMNQLAAMDGAGYIKFDTASGYINSIGTLAGAAGPAIRVAKSFKSLGALGRTAIARVSSVRGIEDATEVASRVMPDGVAPTAAVAEDVVPSAYAQPLRVAPTPSDASPTASTAVPATTPIVNQAQLITKTKANRFYELIKGGFNKGAYGFTDYIDDADSWALARGKVIAQMHSPNLIDYEVITSKAVHEDFLTFKGSWTFGKTGGKTFDSFNSAKQVASSLGTEKNAAGQVISNNGLNATIIEVKSGLPVTKPVKGGKYVIQAEERRVINPGELDLDRVKDKGTLLSFASRWAGVAGLRGDDFTNSLAFSMDAGEGKIITKIGEEFRQAAKVAGKEEVEIVADIIKSARDSGVPQRSWMGVADFTNQYTSLTGRTPSKEVIQFYELTQEASDAAWKLKAAEQLKHLTDLNVLIFKDAKGIEHKIYPYHGIRNTIEGKVLNASTGARLDPSAVPAETAIFKVVEGKSGRSRYLTNVVGKTRLPNYEDAFPYLPYGGRTNPEITGFVGTATDSGWNTALGVKTNLQGKRAVAQINSIDAEFKKLGKSYDPQNPSAGLSAVEIKHLDNTVALNNEWNPNIETWAEYTEFMKGRGVDILEKKVLKERGANLTTFEKYADSFVIHKDLNGLITYSRHDQALVEFGGSHAWNPNPVHAIVRQLTEVSSRIASLQYRVEHVGKWANSLHNALQPGANGGELLNVAKGSYSPMFSPETLARNVEILSDTPLGNKLRQEQNIIVRRLDMIQGSTSESPLFGALRSGWTKSMNSAIETIVDAKDAGRKWGIAFDKIVTPSLRGLRDNTSGKLLSVGFFTKMTSISTGIVQAAAVIPMAAVSPKNAFRGVVLAGHLRELMRHPQGITLLSALRNNIAKAAGLDATEMQLLLDHLDTSGRGFAQGALLEDPSAVPGIKGWGGKIKDVLSSPFYWGENFSQMTSRITAYLDVIEKNPALKTNPKALWAEVTKRDQALSVNMNKSSAGMMSRDSTARVISQWKRYFFSSINTVLFDNKLTAAERVRMGASMTVLWGWAGMGLPNGWFEGDEETGAIAELLKYGPIDFILKETLGITVGNRIGINLIETFSQIGSFESDQMVPMVKIANTAVGALWNAGSYFLAGNHELGAYELGRLVRIAKVVDDAWMAISMLMWDTRKSASANPIEIKKDWTSAQAVIQALGFKPEEVNELFRLSKFQMTVKERQKMAVDKAVPYLKQAMEYGEQGDWETYGELMKDAAAIIDAYDLPPTFRLDAASTALNYAGSDRMTNIILNCVEAGCSAPARDFAEGLK